MKYRTANENDMRLSAAICTANIAAVADGQWALISPYGDHPSPDGSYTQHLDRAQTEKIVSTWNSITGKAARVFKNMWHGLGAKFSTPVWDGHPETDGQRWPVEKLLAEITDVRAGAEGFEGRVTWSANGLERRSQGALFPSALWWHWPPTGEPPRVFPELLESVGLVTTPNIAGVPAWTANGRSVAFQTFAGQSPAENQDQNRMNAEQLKALARALNLPESSDPAKLIETAHSAFQLSTANAAQMQETETALHTANAANAALVTERNQLQTANAALVSEADELRKGVLDLAEKKGALTPAERAVFDARLSTANTRTAALTELQIRKAMNTLPVEINGSRVDLSTANTRADALTRAVLQRMKDDSTGYDAAFAACQRDPQLRPLFDAMQPTAA